MQSGAVLGAGHAEAVFLLKDKLQARREYNVYSHALFSDLVKAFNSVKHEVMSLVSKIWKLYKNAQDGQRTDMVILM